ncbi:hypothetical protein AYI70_g4201 [Smittium culicis]|uniref:Uncharacterized protein n=1 Tax=Smittium culicis TaxID=133412 RepID=A0A1R1Y056_9FUNG|nr:hypothetical protein AYI70_g4201 [Smittium culicis]
MCLYCLIKGESVKKSVFDGWYNLFISSFGYQHVVTLERLRKMGLFEKYKNPNSNIGFGMNLFFGKKATKLQQPVKSPSLADKTKDLTISGINSKRLGIDGVNGSGGSKGKTFSSGLNSGDLIDREPVSEGLDVSGGIYDGTEETINDIFSIRPREPTTTDTFGYLRRVLNLYTPDNASSNTSSSEKKSSRSSGKNKSNGSNDRGDDGNGATSEGEGDSEANELDVSSVYGGYVPITIRLLQCLTRDSFVESGSAGGKYKGKSRSGASNFEIGNGAGEFGAVRAANGGVSGGWRGWEDVLDNVAGANVDISQASSPHSTDQQPVILQGKKNTFFFNALQLFL